MTTVQDTVHSQGRSTYDFYFEIDCDCEELLDAIGLEYKQCEDDDTQNEVCISMDREDFTDVVDQSYISMTNEQTLAAAVLNHELSEYTTSAQSTHHQETKLHLVNHATPPHIWA